MRDVFKKSNKRKLSPEWQKAMDDAKHVGNPSRDLDHSRPERARAAFVVIAMGEDFKEFKHHPKVKKFTKELKGKE